MSADNLTTVQKDRMLHIIYDVFDATTSLKSAAPLFPKGPVLAPGEISASVTVKALTAVIEKLVGSLLDIVSDEELSVESAGGQHE